MVRGRNKRKKSGRYYFTSETEEAIIKYNLSTDARERAELYIQKIEPAFDEMVDKIVFTYKFTTLPNIDSLRSECKVWLTTVLEKFDPSKGSKAFAYFSVITKNWFIHKVKKNSQKSKREVDFGDVPREVEMKYLSTYNKYDENREKSEFWHSLWSEVESWDTGSMKENEIKVLNAIKDLMEATDRIEIFNKKAIYFYIREATGLNTKQVVNNLNKIRMKYKVFKFKWDHGDI
jgi:DNA-directed RNA polymerase specialized sigma subunit